jgi:hypothetical protein
MRKADGNGVDGVVRADATSATPFGAVLQFGSARLLGARWPGSVRRLMLATEFADGRAARPWSRRGASRSASSSAESELAACVD